MAKSKPDTKPAKVAGMPPINIGIADKDRAAISQGLSKLLADNKKGNLTPDQVKYASTILAAGYDLLSLINDILDLAKIEAGQASVVAEPVVLEHAVQSLIEPLRPLAQEKNLVLSAVLEPAPRLDELLALSAALHRHLCPRQVLGARMGLLAGRGHTEHEDSGSASRERH